MTSPSTFEVICILAFAAATKGIDFPANNTKEAVFDPEALEFFFGSSQESVDPPDGAAGGATTRVYSRLWTNTPPQNGKYIIPYVFDSSYPNGVGARDSVFAAFNDFTEAGICIEFVPRTTETYYFSFQEDGTGCWSYVGQRYISYQPNPINLGTSWYCKTKVTVLHEIMHALGFIHEHQRPDRDTYVQVNRQYVSGDDESFRVNWGKAAPDIVDSFGSEYDRYSVMHYGGYAGSNTSGQAVITYPDGSDIPTPSNDDMTASDIYQIKRLYGCEAFTTTEPEVTAAPTESPTEANTEAVTESETEAQTEAATEAATEAETEAMTEAETEAATETATEAATEAETEAATEAETEAVTEAETEAVTEAETEAVTEAETIAATEAETEAATEAETEAATEAETIAATEAETEAATEAETEAATEAETEAATEAETEAATGVATVAETEPMTESATEEATDAETDAETQSVAITVVITDAFTEITTEATTSSSTPPPLIRDCGDAIGLEQCQINMRKGWHLTRPHVMKRDCEGTAGFCDCNDRDRGSLKCGLSVSLLTYGGYLEDSFPMSRACKIRKFRRRCRLSCRYCGKACQEFPDTCSY